MVASPTPSMYLAWQVQTGSHCADWKQRLRAALDAPLAPGYLVPVFSQCIEKRPQDWTTPQRHNEGLDVHAREP
jgi:hypothetical protein